MVDLIREIISYYREVSRKRSNAVLEGKQYLGISGGGTDTGRGKGELTQKDS